MGLLSFLLGEPGQRLVLFILKKKKKNGWFYRLFSIFLSLFPLRYFLSSADYALSILFLILLGSSLGCLFEIFLVFEEGLYCFELPS